MADYVTRAGVPQRTNVLIDIRQSLGDDSEGYTARPGVPQDVDVLMDIRDLAAGGTGTGGTSVTLPSGVTWAGLATGSATLGVTFPDGVAWSAA